MLLRQCRLGNNLPIHIRENTDFLREKPWQLPSDRGKFQRLTPPPFLFMSSLYGSEMPFTKNCAVGKVLSILASIKTRISATISFNCSNLFESEFMLRFPIIILFEFLILSFLISNNRFGEFSLWTYC